MMGNRSIVSRVREQESSGLSTLFRLTETITNPPRLSLFPVELPVAFNRFSETIRRFHAKL